MIICLCNAIKDKQLDQAVSAGAASVGDTFRQLGCQPVCGKCVPHIRESWFGCPGVCAVTIQE